MLAILTLLIVVMISILITRIATNALVHTGLSKETARFQARSAFTGSGFTTSESEDVVLHPIRRRIIMFLMLLGNAGIVTVISSLILTFINPGEVIPSYAKLLVLVTGLTVLWLLASNQTLNNRLSTIIDKMLKKYTKMKVQDYASLMRMSKDYVMAELYVGESDWIANKTLSESELAKEGILVLGIKRTDGTYIGAPRGSTYIVPEDSIFVYGRLDEIGKIDTRKQTRSGDMQHKKAVKEQSRVLEQEKHEDPVDSQTENQE